MRTYTALAPGGGVMINAAGPACDAGPAAEKREVLDRVEGSTTSQELISV